MKQKTIYLLALLLFVFSCSKDKDDNDDNKANDNNYPESMFGFEETCNPQSFQGLEISIDGDISSEIDPESDEFDDYINCITDCSTNNPDDPQCMMDCLSLLGVLPAGGAFSLTIYITNITTTEITYTVEPGDWFEPGSGDYQPMMSPINISVDIRPGETITLVIPVYCLASELSAPDESSEYTMCDMIADNTCLSEIVAILETKDVESFTFMESLEVQQIIWNCTEGEEVDWEYLNNLSDK